MARLPNRPMEGMDQGLMDLMGLAQVSQAMGLNEPPAMNELLKLLGMAGEMENQERELELSRQALELKRNEQNQLTPDMLMALMPYVGETGQRNLINQARPGILPPEPEEPPQQLAPGQKPPPKPTGRKDVKSMGGFLGYTPPSGDVEAVTDEQGNILNFVQKGTTNPVQDFVPSVESTGGWGASKYATAQQLKALGRYLGFAPQPQTTRPY